jgi:hypothetical protein
VALPKAGDPPASAVWAFENFRISEIASGADEFFKGLISRQRQASSLKLWGLPQAQHQGECSDTSTFRGSQTNFAKQNKNKIDTLLAIQVKTAFHFHI